MKEKKRKKKIEHITELIQRFEPGLSKKEASEKAREAIQRQKAEDGLWRLRREEREKEVIKKEFEEELKLLTSGEAEQKVEEEIKKRNEFNLDFQARELLNEAILEAGTWPKDWVSRKKIQKCGLEIAKSKVKEGWEEEKRIARER